MFDVGDYDINRTSREYAAIATHYRFPQKELHTLFDWSTPPTKLGIRIDLNQLQAEVYDKCASKLSDETENLTAALMEIKERSPSSILIEKIGQFLSRSDPPNEISDAEFHFCNKLVRILAAVQTEADQSIKWCNVAGELISDVVVSAGGQRTPHLPKEISLLTRTAIHELGHMLGLHHNHSSTGYMNTTDHIALGGGRLIQQESSQKDNEGEAKSKPFPWNVQLAFDPKDVKFLQHGPDILIRSGGAYSIKSSDSTDAVPTFVADGLALIVEPVPESQEYCAPVRLNVCIRNETGKATPPKTLYIPDDFSFKQGTLSGWIIGPEGIRKPFKSTAVLADEVPSMKELPPYAEIWTGLTLLSGIHEPLFEAPGEYNVHVDLNWRSVTRRERAASRVIEFKLSADTRIQIPPPYSNHHYETSKDLFNNQDRFRNISFHAVDKDAMDWFETIKKDAPRLYRHYRVHHALAYYERFIDPIFAKQETKLKQIDSEGIWKSRLEALRKACDSISGNLVLTTSEAKQIENILRTADWLGIIEQEESTSSPSPKLKRLNRIHT